MSPVTDAAEINRDGRKCRIDLRLGIRISQLARSPPPPAVPTGTVRRWRLPRTAIQRLLQEGGAQVLDNRATESTGWVRASRLSRLNERSINPALGDMVRRAQATERSLRTPFWWNTQSEAKYIRLGETLSQHGKNRGSKCVHSVQLRHGGTRQDVPLTQRRRDSL
jgi:hypothetical protein